MKRLTLIIIGVLLCTPLYSDMNPYIAGVPVSGGGDTCNTLIYGNLEGANNYNCDICDHTNTYFVGQTYVNFDAEKTICKLSFSMTREAGDISGKTYYAVIAPLNGTSMDVENIIATSSGVTGSNSWSETAVDFIFSSGVTLSKSTEYVTAITTESVDASNYAVMNLTQTNVIAGGVRTFTSDGTRTDYSSYDAIWGAYESD